MTLVELLVVLLVLGLVTAASVPAIASLRPPEEAAWIRAVHQARAAAASRGRPVSVQAVADGADSAGTDSWSPRLVLPDGQALGRGIEPLTGEPDAAR